MRPLVLLLIVCLQASGQVGLQHPAFVGSLLAPAAGGGGGSPSFLLATNTVDVATEFLTNTVTINAGDLIVNLWHTYDTHTGGLESNIANGQSMTVIAQTNSYSGTTGTNAGFGAAWFLATSNGVWKVSGNAFGSPVEHSVQTLVYRGANASTPIGAAVVDWSGTTRSGTTNSISTGASDLAFSAVAWNVGAVGGVGSGQTIRLSADPTPDDASLSASDKAGAAGTTTVSWSGFSVGPVFSIQFAIKP